MTEPRQSSVETSAGSFRVLEWPGTGPAVLFLHGLSAVAEVWGPTVAALGPKRPRCIAIDQRGHGSSPQGDIDYRVSAFVEDAEQIIDSLELGQVHLVGHSMGARVALVAAANKPGRYLTTAIVDIGPEQWRQNWVSGVEGFSRMPAGFSSEEDAVAFASRRREMDEDAKRIFLARLRKDGNGLVWRADVAALKAIVTVQRSRNYWNSWDRLTKRATLIRGGESSELRPHVAEGMRRRNPSVGFVEIAGAPHNIPLAAPEALAQTLLRQWKF